MSFCMRCLAGNAINSARICSVFDKSDCAAPATLPINNSAKITVMSILLRDFNMTFPEGWFN